MSGVDTQKTRKLLGIPETCSGAGAEEFRVVREFLMKWEIQQQIVGMVFDTTTSNTGHVSGACTFLEVWLDKPIMWLACRRHIGELHLGSAATTITGATKDPGMVLFRRLRQQ